MMSEIRISDDGSTVVFLRGEAPNREGWSPNPSADPNGPEHAIWAARTNAPGARMARGGRGEPRNCARRQLDSVRQERPDLSRETHAREARQRDGSRREGVHHEWGVQSDPKWSPDGRKIAFVSTRTDHSFIVVYDMATRSVKYMSPSVDFDTAPMWLPDSKHLIFMRRPGIPFGQQAQQGGGRNRTSARPRRAERRRRRARWTQWRWTRRRKMPLQRRLPLRPLRPRPPLPSTTRPA